ncbi:MAG: hypothetical protein MMC33_001214 [Icmadophila ericetorum]|nr:hypothetical protein [Icmadophila ericetorum]
MSESQSSIRGLFANAKALSKQLEVWQTTSQTYQDNLRSAISTFEACRNLVEQVSMFSPNETEDDIASGDLQYLSIDYHLGDLVPKVIDSERKILLRRSQEAYERYLVLLETYGLLTKEDEKLLARYRDNRDAFQLLSSPDPTVRRNTKMARFKQEKELKQKLEHLSSNPAALQNDDATLRDLYKGEIRLHTHLTFHALDLVAQELKILALAPPSPANGSDMPSLNSRGSSAQAKNSYSDRLDAPLSQLIQGGRGGPILSKEGKPLQPFVLLDKRQELQKGVFRPGHSLPTMSIDEYLEEEKRRGGIIEGGGEQSGIPPEVDEDDLKQADIDAIKAREWDEFKEANPKGSGNTLNRG